MINYITVHALSSCLFMQFYEDGCRAHTFLMHKNVRRLSKGRSLAGVFEVQEMLQRFLAAPFSDTEGIENLAYLCDILNLLNELNLSITLGEKDNCV